MSSTGTIKVLLVEDDSDEYRLIAEKLREQDRGVILDWADTVAAAVEKLGRVSYDVILADLSLPDSTGLATISKLRANCASLPIVVLASLDEQCGEQELLQAGAQDYLVKNELSGQATARAISHAVRRQQLQNELETLLAEREQDRLLLEQQAALLRRKSRRLRRLYRTAQEFVDNVSHDFRTPLTVIKDYVAIIREGIVGPINQEQRSMLDKVSVRADDLNHMVDDLLDVSKLEAGLLGAWRRATPVSDIFERVDSMLRQRARVKNVKLTIECEPELPQIYCDADMIGRVITNLAVNAIKFTGEGGQVRLRAVADFAENQVVISVTDNGPGIDDESLCHIFAKFRQIGSHVKSTLKGFGLGLNIAQELCRINLGELRAESRVGEGSTFSFTIPLADPPEVLSRWLTSQVSPQDMLTLMELSLSNRPKPTSADEFDAFLNCLLRKRDLLFRVRHDKWLLVMATPPNGSESWDERARREFRKHNRYRPLGPLPDYKAVTLSSWDSPDHRAAIVAEVDRFVRTETTDVAIASPK